MGSKFWTFLGEKVIGPLFVGAGYLWRKVSGQK